MSGAAEPRRRTRPSCTSSARSACSCAGPGRSPPGWRARCTPIWTAPTTGCSPCSRTPVRCARATSSNRLGLDKSTVSRQVAHLVDLGLVERAADPVDGRAQVLTPSAEGSTRLARIREVRRDPLGGRHVRLAAVRRRDPRRPAAPAEPARRGARGRGPEQRHRLTAYACHGTHLSTERCRQQPTTLYGCCLQRFVGQRGPHAHHSGDPGPADDVHRPARPHRPAPERAGGQPALRRPAVLRLGTAPPARARGDQRCSALALQVGVDVSVASRQLAVLERLGYVERRPDPRDGRASLLRLTRPAPTHSPVRASCAPTGRCPRSPAGTSRTPSSSATCSTAS